MHISAALTPELRSLNQTLDDPTVDMQRTLNLLADAATLAVTSFLGLSITAGIGGQQPFTLTTTNTSIDSKVGASIRMPLSTLARSTHHADGSAALLGALIFYAGVPGAFVDLAADITWLSGFASAGMVLDQDLIPPDADIRSGLEDIVVINQAVGVLLARGYLPRQARHQLDTWAVQRGINRLSAARRLLASLSDQDPNDVTGLCSPGVRLDK